MTTYEDQEPADWRLNPAVLRDDNGAILKAEDVGLAAGQKLTASYVRENPEYPWPAVVRQQVGETTEDRGGGSMTEDDCTCPQCATEDFRTVDEICADPDCRWGQIDPSCPVHGEES